MRVRNIYDFIRKAKLIWGDKYTYDNVVYKDSRTHVLITCPEHGDFSRIPIHFFTNKIGCPVCSKIEKDKNLRLTTSQFIEKAKQVHGDKYDYSKVNYQTNKDKIIIVCPEHGDFEQTPANHLKGQNCPQCAKINQLYPTKLTYQKFIEQANLKHNNKFDYSKVNFIDSTTPVIITCPEHGDFEQKPSHHLNGNVCCPDCIKISFKEKMSKTTEQFITEARQVHGDKFDYSKTIYEHSEKDVIITCKEHGDFKQSPDLHLRFKSGGCKLCYKNIRLDDTETFINKAKQIHQDKYDYSKVDYKKSREKVIITCKKHGDFEQRPNNHLIGQGCPKCSFELTVSKGEMEVFEFINRLLNPECYNL